MHSHWVSIVSNHLIFCPPLLLLPSIVPSIRVFSNDWLFTSSGQRIGASVSASVLPMNIQGWFPLGLIGLISCCPRDSQESSPALQFKSISSWELSLLYGPTLTPIHDYWKTVALTIQTFVGKVLSLVFSLLSKFVIAFLPRSKCFLISWLQSNSWKCNTWFLWLSSSIPQPVPLFYPICPCLGCHFGSSRPFMDLISRCSVSLNPGSSPCSSRLSSATLPSLPPPGPITKTLMSVPHHTQPLSHQHTPCQPMEASPLPLGRGPEILHSFPQQSRPQLRRSALNSQVIISRAFSHGIIVTIFC